MLSGLIGEVIKLCDKRKETYVFILPASSSKTYSVECINGCFIRSRPSDMKLKE